MDQHVTMNLTLNTERLTLRPFEFADANAVQQLAKDVEIARTTLNIPHPYPENGALEWITRLKESAPKGRQYTFAVTDKQNSTLFGSMGIGVQPEHGRGELGYWIGRPYWGQGYGTEAAKAVLDFAFHTLQLNRVYAYAMKSNAGSWRIMEKIGLQYEGTLRQHVEKWGEYIDLVAYGLVKSEA